jgi:hypothetical protein
VYGALEAHIPVIVIVTIATAVIGMLVAMDEVQT